MVSFDEHLIDARLGNGEQSSTRVALKDWPGRKAPIPTQPHRRTSVHCRNSCDLHRLRHGDSSSCWRRACTSRSSSTCLPRRPKKRLRHIESVVGDDLVEASRRCETKICTAVWGNTPRLFRVPYWGHLRCAAAPAVRLPLPPRRLQPS